jgi:iron(III) transport system permease protein
VEVIEFQPHRFPPHLTLSHLQTSSVGKQPSGWGTAGHALDRWTVLVVGVSLLLALPVLTVFVTALQPAGAVWRHLADTVLADYVLNSVALMLGVGVGTLLIGVPAAWLTAVCEFPGRRLFEWALLLPMAIPAYIIAYTYTGLLDFAGPVQTAVA